jgi:hypothetical protein
MTRIAPPLATSKVVPFSNRQSLFRAWELRARLRALLAQGQVAGTGLRAQLLDEITLKVLSPEAGKPVAVVGPAGAGKEHVARFLHRVASETLGRSGALIRLDSGDLPSALPAALEAAAGGTLWCGGLTDREAIRALSDALPDRCDALVLVLIEAPAYRDLPWRGLRIELPSLSERHADIAELCRHFARAAPRPGGLGPDSVARLTEAARKGRIPGVDALRHAVAQELSDACASGDRVPLTQPVLAADSGSPPSAERHALSPGAAPGSAGATFDLTQVQTLAAIHGVPAELLVRQAALISELTASMNGTPRSFRNIMDRSDVVRRIGLWLAMGVHGQSDFRRAFGRQRFMQPSKSSAWAFFNTVFKRDP